MCVVELLSPLPLHECVVRLREVTGGDDLWSWFGNFGSREVVGHVSERSIRLRKRIGYKNSFQTILIGRLERHEAGTIFRGKARMATFLRCFMTVWFGGLVLIGGILSVAAVGQVLGFAAPAMQGNLPLPLVPVIFILMLAFGVGLVRFGRWLARDEERFLVQFLADALEASPNDTRTGAANRPASH